MKNIAVILSGCGYLDGSEITESICTLIALEEKNCNYRIFAPNIESQAVNHLTHTSNSSRNIMTESSRISRGKISPLSKLECSDFDGLAIPGGFGVAKNLSDWAQKGSQCEVLPSLHKIINQFYDDSKPILAICIAPAIVAKSLGKHSISVTIGNDTSTANEIEKTGATHENCKVDDFITDRLNKIVTTPAYMLESTPAKVFKGISLAVSEFSEMC